MFVRTWSILKTPANLPVVVNMADSSANRATNGSKNQDIFVKEELKIAVRLSLDKFRYDEEQKGIVLIEIALIFLQIFDFQFTWSNLYYILPWEVSNFVSDIGPKKRPQLVICKKYWTKTKKLC